MAITAQQQTIAATLNIANEVMLDGRVDIGRRIMKEVSDIIAAGGTIAMMSKREMVSFITHKINAENARKDDGGVSA